MSKAPPIPPEQRSYIDQDRLENPADRLNSAHPDRRDTVTDVQSGQPGDADVNLETHGRFGDIRQNVTPQWKTQDR
ncbi:MAG: hypothetical protein ACXW3D_01925 [Caulobacteraceae bacterium]